MGIKSFLFTSEGEAKVDNIINKITDSRATSKTARLSKVKSRKAVPTAKKECYSFYTFGDETEDAEKATLANLVDKDGKMIKSTGQNLLKRDLKASPAFISLDGDTLNIKETVQVYPEFEEEGEEKAYVMFKTNHCNFAIGFDYECKF